MIAGGTILMGIAAVVLILVLNRGGRRGPSAIIILIVGLLISTSRSPVPETLFQFSAPDIALPSLSLAWEGFYRGGVAQIPLTFTNAVIACAALLGDYFPERRVPEKYLMGNMALMNVGASLLGGFPMCHGAGGLASQYYFGARTGGANIMEGTLEVLAGLFLGSAMVSIFSTFPEALVGAMMLMVGIELGKFSSTIDKEGWPSVVATTAAGVYWNLGIGFLVGLTVHFILRRISDG
ncbi:MAG: putative sulfate/molybdate transporter [Bacillota bacterium]